VEAAITPLQKDSAYEETENSIELEKNSLEAEILFATHSGISLSKGLDLSLETAPHKRAIIEREVK
jgi:hypothetical protein